MAETITSQIQRQTLNLSYAEIERDHPDWSKQAVDDYFYKQSNIYSLTANSQVSDDQVADNTQNIQTNAENIQTNADNLAAHINDTDDAHAASAISYDNTTSGLAATNAQAAIDEVDANLDTHTASESAHGVTGDNIGTEDYAQPSIGGAVLLAALVTDAVDSTVSVDSPDATDLPTVITLANETKADVNQLVTDLNNVVTQLNEFLANNKTAKQMASQEIKTWDFFKTLAAGLMIRFLVVMQQTQRQTRQKQQLKAREKNQRTCRRLIKYLKRSQNLQCNSSADITVLDTIQ